MVLYTAEISENVLGTTQFSAFGCGDLPTLKPTRFLQGK